MHLLLFLVLTSNLTSKSHMQKKLIIPTRFSAETTTAMKTGILKRRHRDEIINSLSTLMLVHTSHPTPDDYTTVCRRLVEKYPNLKDKVDSGYVSTSDKSFNNSHFCRVHLGRS